MKLVATVHFSGDPPGTCLVVRHFQVGAGVAVFIARSELHLPARGGFADELRLVFPDQPAGDLRGIDALPVQLARVAFQIVERVLEHRLHVHGRGG